MCDIGPGPGAYQLPPLIGYKNHDVRKRRGPAFRLGTRTKPLAGDHGPGPSYSVGPFCRFGPTKGPAYSCQAKKSFPVELTPGPNFLERNPYLTNRSHGEFSLGMKLKHGNESEGPGPVYTLPPTLGPKVVDFKTSPAYSMGILHVQQGTALMPGPGHYPALDINLFKKKQPKAVLTGRHKRGTTSQPSPGPSAYFPKYNGPHPPAYSFRLRHNPCLRPLITPLDLLQ